MEELAGELELECCCWSWDCWEEERPRWLMEEEDMGGGVETARRAKLLLPLDDGDPPPPPPRPDPSVDPAPEESLRSPTLPPPDRPRASTDGPRIETRSRSSGSGTPPKTPDPLRAPRTLLSLGGGGG